MRISKHEMARRDSVNKIRIAILDAIGTLLTTEQPTYCEVIYALQEVQSRFVEDLVVDEWREPEESA